MGADKKTKNNACSMATAFSDSCNAQQAEVSDQPGACSNARQACSNAGVPAAVLLFLAYSLAAATVHRAGGERPWDLAFLAFAYADLAALFLCLRRAERLPREPSPAEGRERRRLQLAVWALSSSLSCAFALRLSLIMPAAPLVILVWSMTAFVVLVGFYFLVVCDDQGYCAVADGGDGKSFAKKIAGNGDGSA